MPVLLQVDHLSYRYEEAGTLLRQVSFSVETARICSVVGESGSGKTTLLQLIGGRLDPNEGSIWLSGKQVTGPSRNLVPGHPEIRTVFQDFALSPNLNVYQNIAHVLRAYRSDYREARTHELIRRLGLVGREEHLPTSLSGGEKQRVALARALAEEPVLLLLDEPFSQVDFPLKRRLIQEVVAILRETNGTALFVTHDAHDALSLSDQILVLRQGTVVQQGTPEQIYEASASHYVAQLMGPCSSVDIATFRQWHPDFQANDTTHLGIRPEHIRLLHKDEGIEGHVLQCHYQGAFYALTIEVANGILLIAHSDRPVAPSTTVYCHILTEHSMRYRSSV